MKQAGKILVIDDDVILLRRVDTLLSSNGFEVITAKNGSDGIRYALEKKPDIILCDIWMPGVMGYYVFNILRRACVVYHTPFVFMSGKSELKEVRKGMLLGADDYIIKPFENNDLLNTIKGRLLKNNKFKGLVLDDFKQLLNFSTDGLFLSSYTTFVEVNKSLTDLLGYSASELKGKSVSDFLMEPEREDFKSWMVYLEQGINAEFRKFLRVKTKYGIVNANLYVVPVKGHLIPNAEIMGVFQSHKGAERSQVFPTDPDDMDYQDQSIEVALDLKGRFDQENPQINLSAREKEVLVLSCNGLTIKEVATKLYISDRTVEKHRSTLMEKFSAKNFIEVALIALKLNVIKI